MKFEPSTSLTKFSKMLRISGIRKHFGGPATLCIIAMLLLHPTKVTAMNAFADINPFNIIKAGWITKKGRVRKNWNRRYFVLLRDSNEMVYYEESTTSCKKDQPKGSITLTHDSRIVDESTHDKFKLSLITPKANRTWKLKFEYYPEKDTNRWDKNVWKSVFQAKIKKLRENLVNLPKIHPREYTKRLDSAPHKIRVLGLSDTPASQIWSDLGEDGGAGWTSPGV